MLDQEFTLMTLNYYCSLLTSTVGWLLIFLVF